MKKHPITFISISSISLLIIACIYTTSAFSKQPARIISGWVEKVIIENQDFDVKAKLDTGARTSSIYAIDIEPFKKDQKRWVKFTLLLKDSKDKVHKLELEKPRVRKALIKNHNGEHDRRYVVDLEICFNERKYVTEFNLVSRNEYIYNILLGRQFLKEIAIIDPAETFLTQAKCEVENLK